MSKISIVVPVYKVEKYLRRCVDSILNQTYENIEVILVDDGSPDSSGAICDEYEKKDSRVKVIHQENKGLSGARNTGIDIATGEYLGFVDSDDYIHEQMYEILFHHALENNCDISICRLFRFSGETAEMESPLQGECHVLSKQQALINLHGMDGQVYTVAWNKLYKRELFYGLRYPLRKINEDEFLTYKIIDRANQIVLSDEILYYYFQNGDSITTNSKYLVNQDVFEALDERKSYFAEKKNIEIIAIIQKAYLDRIISRFGMLLHSKKNNQLVFKEMWMLYRTNFDENKNNIHGIGYRIFYYMPKVYFTLLNMKNAVKV